MKHVLFIQSLAVQTLTVTLAVLAPGYMHAAVDWPKFMERQDMVWEQLPRQWNEGAFVGNGMLGMVVYATLNDNRLDFHLGRADVTDHRKAPDRKSSMGVSGASVFFDYPRLDIGRMALRPAGKITGGTLRQDLWNAEITGTVVTDLGELRFRALSLRQEMVQVVEVTSTEKNATGRPVPWQWEFRPGNPASPRAQVKPDQAAKEKYQTNPDPVSSKDGDVSVCLQKLLAGGDYATAWREVRSGGGVSSVLYVSTANEVPQLDKSAPLAVADVRRVSSSPLAGWVTSHRNWWHDFYPRTFLSVPDTRLEAFYWLQMHKLAAAWREDAPAIDLFGPWFRVSQWPGIWWNLNIQLTYWPVYAGNRLEIGQNYLDLVDQHFESIFIPAAKGRTLGDFAWALHNYWWHLRFAGDWPGIQQRWMPKAKRMADAYIARLQKRPDGRLGLPQMGSPEFHGFAPFDDTNYNLGLLRWLLNALIEAREHAGGPAPAEEAEWRRVLAGLVDYPVDANGLMIGSNQPLDESHRHFSHLLPLYPLYQMNPDDPRERELLIRSVRHWHGIGGGKGLAGYSFTGGAAIYASLGLGDEALGMLNDFLDNVRGGGKVLPNTLYVETGGRNPCIETPLSAASSTMDLLLQSWRGTIRVFPAVPTTWKDACFENLRAMDGFIVSAARRDGRTTWVRLRSESGAPCRLRVPDWKGPLRATAPRTLAVVEEAPGEYRIDLQRQEEVLLQPATAPASEATIQVVSSGPANPFGVKKGREITSEQFWPEVAIPWTPPQTP
ncbi:MAG: hypothetical protein SFU85_00295 [Candidatus Methylacidiphilales bacterium]|nr:hypothetical protein [Candidatus Methylacidiphilales bacterium]